MSNYQYAISFSEPVDGEIVHCVCIEQSPNIATFKDLFNELMFDDEFGFHNRPYVDSLIINVVDYNIFAKEFPNWVPGEHWES